MADTPIEKIREEIKEFLKDADLSSASSKKVRAHLNDKFDCDFSDRKKEIDKVVMEVLTELEGDEKKASDEDEDSVEEDSGDNYSEDEKPKAKRKAAPKKPAPKKKRAKGSDSEDDDESEDDDYSEDERKKKKKQRASNGAAKGRKAAAGGGGGAAKGKTGYLKRLKLSTELAEVMGEEFMARNEVVKKMYAVVKERDLLDPKNRQYAILDDQLQKVFGQKRVRMFGMLKLLGKHFSAPE